MARLRTLTEAAIMTDPAKFKKHKNPARTIYQQRVSIHDSETGALLGSGYAYYDRNETFYQYFNDLRGDKLPNGNYDIRPNGEVTPVVSPLEVQ